MTRLVIILAMLAFLLQFGLTPVKQAQAKKVRVNGQANQAEEVLEGRPVIRLTIRGDVPPTQLGTH